MVEVDVKEYIKLKKRATALPLRETTCKYFCPVCSRVICGKQNRRITYGTIYYCPRCGQHLDTRKLIKD